jgi:hypothetical protein
LFRVTNSPSVFIPAGGALPVTLTAYNDSGAVVRNAKVQWSVSGPSAAITPASGVTGADGTVSAIASFGAVAGSFSVSGSLDENPNPQTVGAGISGSLFPATPPIVQRFVAPAGTTSLNTIRIRDGLAFIGAANSGVLIYDVGNGIKGGSPANAQLVSQAITSSDGLGIGVAAYSSWWFQNPVTGEKRYLFVGQSWGNTGDILGTTGNLHVVDISDLAHPVEVASLHSTRGGFHDLVMDEQRQVLYAGIGSGGGVLRIPVSGTLAGDISSRIDGQLDLSNNLTSRIWSVALVNGFLVASDVDRGLVVIDPVGFTGQLVEPKGAGMTDLWGGGGNVLFSGFRSPACQGADEVGARVFNTSSEIKLSGGYQLLAGGCTISDVSGPTSGKLAMFSVITGRGAGLWFYQRANSLNTPIAWFKDTAGVRASEYAVINGRSYVFALRETPSLEVVVFDVTALLPP